MVGDVLATNSCPADPEGLSLQGKESTASEALTQASAEIKGAFKNKTVCAKFAEQILKNCKCVVKGLGVDYSLAGLWCYCS